MTRNDVYKSKDKKDGVKLNPDIFKEMTDETNSIGVAPYTIFLKDIGKIDVLDMTGTINKATGESKLLLLDDAGGMWQIKDEFIIGHRVNIMKPEDYEHFNNMKEQSEENTKKWEENEKKLGLNSGFM